MHLALSNFLMISSIVLIGNENCILLMKPLKSEIRIGEIQLHSSRYSLSRMF